MVRLASLAKPGSAMVVAVVWRCRFEKNLLEWSDLKQTHCRLSFHLKCNVLIRAVVEHIQVSEISPL